MEREIKFRGRSRKDGKLAYGDLLRHDDGEVLIGVHSEGWTDDGFHFDVYKCVVPVYEESVGQFTGLHDSNGNEIYEGDLLADGDIMYRVVFADFQWCVESDGHRQGIRCLRFVGECKVNVTVLETEPEGDVELNESGLAIGNEPEGYKMVDLGLPSGLKWADRNVGAENIEDYGDYFMWGSTTPDTDKPCNWAHCPFNDGATAFGKTYFNEHKSEWLDGDVLKAEYDAARTNMGDGWRMPTSAEMRELLEWTTQSVETLNGVKGMRFTSKTNGNSIFIPLAGHRDESDVNYAGNYGYAWSSSLYASHADSSLYLYFNANGSALVYISNRYDGFAVRGVCQ